MATFTRKNRAVMVEQLGKDEGFRKNLYLCSAGKQTIGFGRNLEDRGVTREEATYLLNNDIELAIKDAEKFTWFEDLNQARKAVVVNMIFNIGLPTFKKFKNTIRLIKAGDYDEASVEMLDSRWARQVGSRARRLSREMKKG